MRGMMFTHAAQRLSTSAVATRRASSSEPQLLNTTIFSTICQLFCAEHWIPSAKRIINRCSTLDGCSLHEALTPQDRIPRCLERSLRLCPCRLPGAKWNTGVDGETAADHCHARAECDTISGEPAQAGTNSQARNRSVSAGTRDSEAPKAPSSWRNAIHPAGTEADIPGQVTVF